MRPATQEPSAAAIAQTLHEAARRFVVETPDAHTRNLALEAVIEHLRQQHADVHHAFFEVCAGTPIGHPWLHDSFMAHATLRDDPFVALAESAESVAADLQKLRELIWNVNRWLFRNPTSVGGQARAHIDSRFRALYRKTADQLVERLAVRRAAPTDRLRRVAIVTPQLLGLPHAPTRDALWLGAELQRQGIASIVVNANTMPITSELDLFRYEIGNRNDALAGLQHLQPTWSDYRDDLAVYTPVAHRSVERHCRDVLEALEQADVDAVIAHETLFLQDVLAARWPTLWIATGGDVPYARCDAIWVPAELVTDGTRARAAANGNPEILARQLLFTLPEDAAPADRAELALPSDAVVLLSIGTRLANEIDASFRTLVADILRAEPSAWLLLVGPGTEPMPAQFDADIRGRVRGIGLHDSPRALYRSCDVYLNPFRTGGGTSAQTAMADGMPIVTLASGDVGAVAGAALAVADKASYRDHLLALVRDPQARAASSDRSRARIRATFDFPAQVAEIVATLQRLAATPR